MTKVYNIYQMFLEYPHLSACLVFHDCNYYGVLLKKDLERHLTKNSIHWEDVFIQVPSEHLEDVIFCSKPHMKLLIPYVNLQGDIVGSLLYEEFVSEFFPEDFSMKLSFKEIFEYHENPLMILNRFKTILYINFMAKELLSEKVFGNKISDALLAFELFVDSEEVCLSRQDELWQLLISKSVTPYSQYYIYQFIPKKAPL